ncbi:MAG: hypothetical protein GX879_10855 [Bacteroidales bacterium]|nr:hypothetical protein [Bacteroidales bacterium]
MLTISINKKFVNEKKHVLDFVFNEVFGREYQLTTDEEKSYRISKNNKTLVIPDEFFLNFDDGFPYYKNPEFIPSNIEFTDYPEFDLLNIPVIYGKSGIKYDGEKTYLNNDIFAGIFFMLTRWEEVAISKFDSHSRFVEEENLSVKFDFYSKPVVNEYIELIEKLLLKLGILETVKIRDYQLFITHDIDDYARYDSFLKFLKALGGDIIKRKSIKTFANTIKDYFGIIFRNKKDIYDRFDFLMDLSEEKNVKSRFYFIPGHKGEYDVRFDIRSKRLAKTIENIKARNHIVGIHPSYSSFCNQHQLKKEKERLSQHVSDIIEGRQHYLRFKTPDTWQDWDDLNIKFDSSIGFYARTGFRAGICFEYPVFNVVSRKQLKLRERPLIVMDTALRAECKTKEKSLERFAQHAELVKKYKGDFVLLWHNSNLSVNEWKDWDKVYKQIIEKL